MPHATGTINVDVPDQLLRQIATVTRALIVGVGILEDFLPEAERLRTTVETLTGDDDDLLDPWIDQSGLRDLLDVAAVVQAQTADFTQSMARPMTREQARELVDTVRENLDRRLAGAGR